MQQVALERVRCSTRLDALVDGALLVVAADDLDAATALLDEDPFRTVGVVVEREIREWVQVMGPWAPSA